MEMVAFFYDYETAQKALRALEDERMHAELIDTRMELSARYVPGDRGHNGHRVMVPDALLAPAHRVLVEKGFITEEPLLPDGMIARLKDWQFWALASVALLAAGAISFALTLR